MAKSTGLDQNFKDRLLSLVERHEFESLSLKEAVTIEKLGTLTKLSVRHRQCIRELTLEKPIIVVVLRGNKTIYLDDCQYLFQPGELFCVPPGIAITVINQPDEKDSLYLALVLELSSHLLERIRSAYPKLIDRVSYASPLQFKIPLTKDLANSLVYLLESALNDISNHNLYLNEHRVMEVVLLLLNSEWREQLLQIIYPDLPMRVANILCQDLSQPWTTAKLAAELNISVSTLKRQLKKHQTSFRQILTAARMEKAMELIQQDKYAIAQVAIACGYESPSRFASRFYQYFEIKPTQVKRNLQR
ncbi:MAG: helix-turn-helix domain-containing protein [Cyanobacteria bacterium J06582_2]